MSIRLAISEYEHQEEAHHEFPEKRLNLRAGRQRCADVGDVAERAAEQRGGRERAEQLSRPVADGPWPGEVPAEREGEGDGGVEVRAGDVPDGVDHRHDHEPEREGDTDVAERTCFRVDHDRAAAGEDERERADELGHEQPHQRPVDCQLTDRLVGRGQFAAAPSSGSSSSISCWTRASSSSRILRTVGSSRPAGSSSAQSSYFLPG
jgi:hypothetical protein